MDRFPTHTSICAATGPAQGRISGFNHVVLLSHDIDAGVRFYRDILGLRIVRTRMLPRSGTALADEGSGVLHQIFFSLANGALLALLGSVETASDPDSAVMPGPWPEGPRRDVRRPGKLDHLAFDVDSQAELVWFQRHLRESGTSVSEVMNRHGRGRFVNSIYFHDPSGNPLEISTFDWGDAGWHGFDFDAWLGDVAPPEAVLK